MSKKKIAILHFYPIEYYPPVLNLLNYLSTSNAINDLEISVFTCSNDKGRKPYSNDTISIYRFELAEKGDSNLIKSYKYVKLIFRSMAKIIKLDIETIIYFESISSLPATIYKRFFNQNCRIFIHYHEYAPKSWYEKYMKFVKYSHFFESHYLYRKASWISQTNSDRLKLFQKDHSNIDTRKMHVMPNFPPMVWRNYLKPLEEKRKNKIVYVGSLAFESTYIREFCEWIKSQEYYTLDIYSYNFHPEVENHLKNIHDDKIRFFPGGIEYDLLPIVLNKYDIGIILYKGYSENVIYCAPNKLFEYLACDLNVFFSKELLGCYQFVNSGSYPEVNPIDFLNLEPGYSFRMKTKGNYKPQHYWCEDVYNELLIEIS